MKFGMMNYYEALTFLEELEEENDVDLDFYKAKLEEESEDEFELVYYQDDEEFWSLESITKNYVLLNYEGLAEIMKGNE
ncbi:MULTISPECIES: hypothetical protein [Cetobacterium]|jgi:hypothetical protein|uniref:Uncharacterized protein n=1 Tax=Candidatus Cetobacterium colombiensis TaxID=3073100 RepID=A0ABU4WDQ7_9FUSO|nr:hypothetical protein [Candidatus Cetobacterium colombiensis]MDX8336638.1 hypothetical protein [Candidatus Cetobacterium colombiensis]